MNDREGCMYKCTLLFVFRHCFSSFLRCTLHCTYLKLRMTSFFVQNCHFWVSQIYFVMSLWPGLKFNSPVMWKASHSCNSKQVCVFFKRYFMVSGRKLRAILCPSLKGHSFVCVTVIGLKSPDISSRDSSVHYRSLLSWLAQWDDLWLKSWRETGRQKLKKTTVHTGEWLCLCLLYTMMLFPCHLSFNDMVAMVLHDVRCKFLPGNSICQEGTVTGIRLLRKNVHVWLSPYLWECWYSAF